MQPPVGLYPRGAVVFDNLEPGISLPNVKRDRNAAFRRVVPGGRLLYFMDDK